jgi:hypothetical protein
MHRLYFSISYLFGLFGTEQNVRLQKILHGASHFVLKKLGAALPLVILTFLPVSMLSLARVQ